MKKFLYLGSLCFLIFYACLDTSLPNVNGMWQLKTIQSEDGNIQKIDTLYYSFQRQVIFSYTLLFHENNNYAAHVLYGYVYFPEEGKMHIQMDRNTNDDDRIQLLPWKDYETYYDIVKLTSKEMVLFSEGKTYNFIKF
jgi:hypothetical protein